MPATIKRLEELLKKANTLPLCPGVYIMRDKNGKIIYVGKSRKLKNRVSQYFQHSRKNKRNNSSSYSRKRPLHNLKLTEIADESGNKTDNYH